MPRRDEDQAFKEKDIFTRKAERLDDLHTEVTDQWVIAFFGVVMGGVSVMVTWATYLTLRAGYIDSGEGHLPAYAAEEPGFFYGTIAIYVLMAGLCGKLCVQMLLHARRELHRVARFRERVSRVGKGGLGGRKRHVRG
ncbi:MAG TPA: hypothetical protein VE871_21130 [Longimicrobium sp.]|nr:hypothetical protein [Longimicrobium sp.]